MRFAKGFRLTLSRIDFCAMERKWFLAFEWPGAGRVELSKVSLRYGPQAPYVLRNITCRIQPGEKIGIVGRSGAGKSSLISALFRLTPVEGQIRIDGLDIHRLPLQSSDRGSPSFPRILSSSSARCDATSTPSGGTTTRRSEQPWVRSSWRLVNRNQARISS